MKKKIDVKLATPKSWHPPQSHESLLDIAAKREKLYKEKTDNEEILFGRFAEAVLWSTSLTMLHFTLDLLVTHQYAVEIVWPEIISRAVKAFPVILSLLYTCHPHPSPSILLPTLPVNIQPWLHQIFFFLGSIVAGGYLIHATNVHPYYAFMKQVPPLGCLLVWSIIELDILAALGSLICCGIILKAGGYSFL